MTSMAKEGVDHEIATLEAALHLDPNDAAARGHLKSLLSTSPRAGQYQARDWDLVNYQLASVSGVDFPVRGPAPDSLAPGSYFVVLGSAAAFGVLCPVSYGGLLADTVGLPVLNLGHGGAGPEFYLRRATPEFLALLNNARAVVVEVMSARSTSSYLYRSVDGRRMAVPRGQPDAKPVAMEEVVRTLFQKGDTATVESLVRSMQVTYVNGFRKLLSLITTQKAVFYLSKRKLADWSLDAYLERKEDQKLDVFPQLVEDWMLDAIACRADHFVSTVSSSGLPSRAVDRFSGQETVFSFNNIPTQAYYPSSEMHADAARDLAAALGPCLRIE